MYLLKLIEFISEIAQNFKIFCFFTTRHIVVQKIDKLIQTTSERTNFYQIQRQKPEVFCLKSCSQKFRTFHKKTLVLES